MQAKLVILESPYAGATPAAVGENIVYARRCAHFCALQGEATQASHLYYTQFLDDNNPTERELGMALGLAWKRVADYSVFFTDKGWSRGMIAALLACITDESDFRIRSLVKDVELPVLPGRNKAEAAFRLTVDYEKGKRL